MYRHDRNYEQLFNDVRNKLDQVGSCIGGNRASMQPLTSQETSGLSSVTCLVHLSAEGLSANLSACLEYVQTGLLLSVRLYEGQGYS